MISGKARLTGVIGWPVSHSLSPILHNYWLELHNIDGAYIPLPTVKAHLGNMIHSLVMLGFAGANVTIPHKEAAFKLVNEVTEQAKRVKAVNTLKILGNGKIVGDNTDSFGFVQNLNNSCKTWRKPHRPAVIVGAGGAARSVILGLQDSGITNIRIVNRTISRARSVAKIFGNSINVFPWAQRQEILENAGILINTTALGMTSNPPLDLNLKILPRDAVVTDIVYSPIVTPLLKSALRRGNTVVDGLGMLIYQALPGFTAWYNVEPKVTKELRQRLLEFKRGSDE